MFEGKKATPQASKSSLSYLELLTFVFEGTVSRDFGDFKWIYIGGKSIVSRSTADILKIFILCPY
jgi:hypothetical protein